MNKKFLETCMASIVMKLSITEIGVYGCWFFNRQFFQSMLKSMD